MAKSIPMVSRALLASLRQVVGEDGVVSDPGALTVYECDAYTLEKWVPSAVVLPRSTEETAAVVRLLSDAGLPFLPRGAGTNLSGGTYARDGAVMIALTRMNRILSVDARNRRAVVQAGVVNLHLTRRTQPLGLHYAPDPSSQSSCTIGGNVAENSGGPHTLKYGVTTNHVLAIEVVLPDGRIVHLGRSTEDPPGYDLRGLFIGSEGTFGLVTTVTVRLTPLPQAARTLLAIYDDVADATRTVSTITARGILPAALEMMDALIIESVEKAFHMGFPLDAAAILIIELDGLAPGLDAQAERVMAICREHHARDVRLARDEAERAGLWQARKKAIGAVGRITPSFCTQDGVIPRSRLPQVLAEIAAIGTRYGLRVANVFHAGDGNLHPILLFDEREPEQVQRVMNASHDILKACVDAGGTLTGEHGIGIEKIAMMPLLFSPVDLEVMGRLRQVFNPRGLCNPGKVLPDGHEPVPGVRKVQGI
ncbi:MAG TPA: FAD-linked oxidase C-terminal domain-containing protein [Candidatus Xenobia bacterium]